MLNGISRKGRLILGRLDRGDDLEEALLKVCSESSVRCGELRLLGALSHVELCAYDQKKLSYSPSRKFSGNLEILTILGNVSEKNGVRSLHLHATLARDTDNGIEVIGGHLLSGKVFAVEYTIQTCEDLILRRSMDEKTGLSLWTEKIEFPAADNQVDSPDAVVHPPTTAKEVKESEPKAETTPKSETKATTERKKPADSKEGEVSWDDVLSATMNESDKTNGKKKSETIKIKAISTSPKGTDSKEDLKSRAVTVEPAEEESPEDESLDNVEIVEPQPGDILIHPQFGECKVERLEDGEFLHVRMDSGRSIRLNMEILNLYLSGFEKGKQVFETRIGRS